MRLAAAGMMVQLLKSWLGVGILVVDYMAVAVLRAVAEMGLRAVELWMDLGLRVVVDIAFAVVLAPDGIGLVESMSVVHKTVIEGLVGFGMDLAV